MDHTRPASGLTPPDDELAEKKVELRQAVRSFDPLSPLRRHPFVTMGVATALGITVGSEAAAETVEQGIKAPWRRKLITFALGHALRYFRPGQQNSESP